jgi:4'-phosphopantetheinyl transferase
VSGATPLSRDDPRVEPVRVWCLPLERDAARLAAWRAALPAEEQARAARFRQPDDAARLVLGRTALRRVLGARLQCSPAAVPLVPGPNGKPVLPPESPPWQFNLSHSGDWLLLALAWRRRVGIDVEAWRDLEYAALAERAFAPEERAALAAAPAAERAATFFAVWTRKEALLKARGLGLGAFPLDEFAVEPRPHVRPQVIRWRGESHPGRAWRLFSLPILERCSACLAVEHHDEERDVPLELEKAIDLGDGQ